MTEQKESRLKEISAFAKPIFLKWEKLRILYNAILLATLLASHLPQMSVDVFFQPLMLVIWLIGAVLANLCFFLGPAMETYIAWLGVRSIWVTAILFLVGVVISIPLVLFFFPVPFTVPMD
jgi:hypothetical protein